MQPQDLVRALVRHSFCSEFPESVLQYLGGCTKNVRFEAGQYLFREGDQASSVFLLREGRVGLAFDEIGAQGESFTAEVLGAGDVIGWSTLFSPWLWRFDGHALEPTLAFAIDGVCLRQKLDSDPAFGYIVTRRLLFETSRRLERARLQQLAQYRASQQSKKQR